MKEQPPQQICEKKYQYSVVLEFLRGSTRVLSDHRDELPQFGVTV